MSRRTHQFVRAGALIVSMLLAGLVFAAWLRPSNVSSWINLMSFCS